MRFRLRPWRLRGAAGRIVASRLAGAVAAVPLAAVPLVAVLLLAAGLPAAGTLAAVPLRIVAAERVYADVARQIAGPAATVTSVLNNPAADPHLFEAAPSVARAVANARIVVANGAGYDPWMEALLRANPAPGRRVLVIARLLSVPAGSNPHLWYDPAAMPAYADALARALTAADPAEASAFAARLARFRASLRPLDARIAALRARFAGTPVTATEPVFGRMAAALGLTMRNRRFQIAVMNGTEPAPGDVAAFDRDLRTRAVRVLIYNRQATTPATRRLLDIARRAGVPVLGVTETEPAGLSYQAWIGGTLDALEAALAAPPHP